MSAQITPAEARPVPAAVRKYFVIEPASPAHRLLLALRPGSAVEHEHLLARIGDGVGTMLTHLQAAGYVERTAGKATNKGACYRITEAGRIACPPRRGTFTDYPCRDTRTIGDLS